MSVYPNLLSIYNYETFQSNKLVLEGNNITSEIQDVGIILKNYLIKKIDCS